MSRDQVQQAVTAAWSQYKAAVEQVSANRELVAANQLALNGVIEERNVGQRTTLDVLNQQADVIDAQINLATSERDAVVASYAILSAIGRLSPRTLALNVTEYQPKEHYARSRTSGSACARPTAARRPRGNGNAAVTAARYEGAGERRRVS